MVQTKADESGNINLGLNQLTIDDVIWRVIALSEPNFRAITPTEYKGGYRQRYGAKVFEGKVVVVRSDLNSSVKQIDDNEWIVTGTDRIRASVPTIEELSGYGAKVVVMAHQGTVGKRDCISLKPHKEVLERMLRKPVRFESAHWYGSETVDIIERRMMDGEVFLLENLRMLSVEKSDLRDPKRIAELPDTYMRVLGRLASFYVNDAFSTGHRWDGSILGFPHLLNIGGRLTKKEIKENKALISDIQAPYAFLLGGVKVSGYIDFIKDSLDNNLVDYILAAGVLGIIAVLGTKREGKRIDLGKRTEQFLRENELYQLIREVGTLAKEPQFVMPLDFKVELGREVQYMTPEEIHNHPRKDDIGIYGIGPKTVELFKDRLGKSKTVYIKGSPTKDDDERFLPEAKELIDEVVRLHREARATTILSGGDTNSLVSKFGYSGQRDFSYFTLAGGAASEYHAGNLLPGLLMLNTSFNAFFGRPLETGLPLGYKVGFELIAPKIPENLKPFRR
ncbi:MAG: phosphoglycerate kinase [Candidatus Aenigmatarchaeota archaeon]